MDVHVPYTAHVLCPCHIINLSFGIEHFYITMMNSFENKRPTVSLDSSVINSLRKLPF